VTLKNLFLHLVLEVEERGLLIRPHQVRAAHAHQETAVPVHELAKNGSYD
jgi:hypothetical protein